MFRSTPDDSEDSFSSSSSWGSSSSDESDDEPSTTTPAEDRSTAASSLHSDRTPEFSASVPPDQERQLLLLMLLAQVCALHDPTPRTFTVHVLELFERGILDRPSIRFLFDMGLVPPSHHPPRPTNNLLTQEDTESNSQLALRNTTVNNNNPAVQRSSEASAIRQSLHTSTTDWSVENHPLSLSRYQREFRQVKLLSSGSFGQVFQATNLLDGFDYAIKRVPFVSTGYSKDAVSEVAREVQCLAVCDHPHVVRYYHSWLEPSWMTGTADHKMLPVSLQDAGETTSDLEEMHEYVPEPTASLSLPRRYSLSAVDDLFESDDDSSSDDSWTMEQSKDDSDWAPKQQSPTSRYRYQICLFIQMQLCRTETLADWIRTRNKDPPTLDRRLQASAQVFRQVVDGLQHVHSKGIVHRDLKPANIFVDHDDGVVQFKIGDFGLSKMKATSSPRSGGGHAWNPSKNPLLLASTEDEATTERTWNDPWTAGVGTASYAAPEQVATNSYGKEADIYSLGLILLELVCCFSTEHERLQTFQDCRQRRVVPEELSTYPLLTDTILQCTHKDPLRRPSASDLAESNLSIKLTAALRMDSQHALRQALEAKKAELDESQRTIASLQKERDELLQLVRGRIPPSEVPEKWRLSLSDL